MERTPTPTERRHADDDSGVRGRVAAQVVALIAELSRMEGRAALLELDDVTAPIAQHLRQLGLRADTEVMGQVALLGLAEVYAVFRERWDGDLFVSWLLGPEAALGGRSPIAVLGEAGTEPILKALTALQDSAQEAPCP